MQGNLRFPQKAQRAFKVEQLRCSDPRTPFP